MSQPLADEDNQSEDPRDRSRSASGWLAQHVVALAATAWLTRRPVVLAVAACAVGAVVLMGLFAAFGVVATAVRDDIRYQCASAGFEDPSASATTPASEPAEEFTAPTTNPYAALDPDDGDPPWMHACSGALKHAPHQGPPIREPNHGAAVECAARLAVDLVGRLAGQASLVRFVIYNASTASLTGSCQPPLPPVSDSPADDVPPAADLPSATDSSADTAAAVVDLPPASTCPESRPPILLPDTVAAQGVCGQRVDVSAPAAVSAGDLVFWDHRDNNGPTRVGIALGPTAVVTTEDVTGQVVQQQIPVGDNVRVKRILPGRLTS